MTHAEVKRDPAIDGLRGFGALFVVFVHWVAINPHFNHGSSYLYLTEIGMRTMGVFFCLSGLLVYGALLRLDAKGFSFREFFIRRAFRLLPLWWVTLTILFLLQGKMSFGVYLANSVLFMGNLQNGSPFLPMIASWTLFVEEIFYVLAPFLFRLLGFRNAVFAFGSAFLISWIWKESALQIVPASWGLRTEGVMRSPLANFQYFFLGVVLYHAIYGDALAKKFGSFKNKAWPFAFDFLAILTFGDLLKPWGFRFPSEIGVAALIWACTRRGGVISYLARRPFLIRCGIWCYGIYILQEATAYYTHWAYLALAPQYMINSPWVNLLAICLFEISILIVAGAAAFRWIEAPMIDLGKKVAGFVTPPKTAPESSSAGRQAAS